MLVIACAGFHRKKSKNEQDVRGQLYNIFAIKNGYMVQKQGSAIGAFEDEDVKIQQ